MALIEHVLKVSTTVRLGTPVRLMLLVLLGLLFQLPLAFAQVSHYVFFSNDREGISDTAFLNHRGLQGAQVTYHWKVLEPKKGRYDFSKIEHDLAFLQSHGKKLWIQLQDVTFIASNYACPDYLRSNSKYHGGANAQYEFTPSGKIAHGGNVTRRWDPAVARRFQRLVKELGRRFDGRIAGINLPETAVSFPDTLGLRPPDFTAEGYLVAVKDNMRVMRRAFKRSVALQYANFMPDDEHGEYLAEVYRYGKAIGMAMGGPDIKVYRRFQMKHSYPLIRASHGQVLTGAAVQQGNYDLINDRTGKTVTVSEILHFGRDYLQLDFMFWCREEPFFSTQVLPMLR